MAAYFQLLSLENGEPVAFNAIDVEICAYLRQPVDPDNYVLGWYNSIGTRVACGSSLDDVIATYRGYIDEQRQKIGENEDNDAVTKACEKQELYYLRMIDVVNFLKTRYTTNNWISRG